MSEPSDDSSMVSFSSNCKSSKSMGSGIFCSGRADVGVHGLTRKLDRRSYFRGEFTLFGPALIRAAGRTQRPA